jgi:hypothetical protein
MRDVPMSMCLLSKKSCHIPCPAGAYSFFLNFARRRSAQWGKTLRVDEKRVSLGGTRAPPQIAAPGARAHGAHAGLTQGRAGGRGRLCAARGCSWCRCDVAAIGRCAAVGPWIPTGEPSNSLTGRAREMTLPEGVTGVVVAWARTWAGSPWQPRLEVGTIPPQGSSFWCDDCS